MVQKACLNWLPVWRQSFKEARARARACVCVSACVCLRGKRAEPEQAFVEAVVDDGLRVGVGADEQHVVPAPPPQPPR